MSVNWSWKAKMGEIIVEQAHISIKATTKQKYKINLYGANCLFAMIFEFKEDGKEMYTFYGFFNDHEHLKRCIGLAPVMEWDYDQHKRVKRISNIYNTDTEKWIKIKLNTFYKDNLKTAKLLTQAGFKVELYYKEIK